MDGASRKGRPPGQRSWPGAGRTSPTVSRKTRSRVARLLSPFWHEPGREPSVALSQHSSLRRTTKRAAKTACSGHAGNRGPSLVIVTPGTVTFIPRAGPATSDRPDRHFTPAANAPQVSAAPHHPPSLRTSVAGRCRSIRAGSSAASPHRWRGSCSAAAGIPRNPSWLGSAGRLVYHNRQSR